MSLIQEYERGRCNFMTFDRMDVQKEIFKDDFGTVHIIIWIVMFENGADETGRKTLHHLKKTLFFPSFEYCHTLFTPSVKTTPLSVFESLDSYQPKALQKPLGICDNKQGAEALDPQCCGHPDRMWSHGRGI